MIVDASLRGLDLRGNIPIVRDRLIKPLAKQPAD
jgi:hypothetical protein